MKKIMIIVGEPSADKYLGYTIKELKQDNSDIEIFGTGGVEMEKAGMEILFHSNDMAFMGFFEVVKHLGTIRKFDKILKNALLKRKPDLLILCDYPGYNLRFAEFAKKQNIPIYYFISPQIWAWKKGRIKKIKKLVDKMFVILPFEKELYDKEGVNCEYIGHPLPHLLQPEITKEDFEERYNLKDKKVIGLLPGSRKQELNYILPEMLKAAKTLHNKYEEFSFVLALASNLDGNEVKSRFQIPDYIIVEKNITHSVMKYSDFAFVTSGTATLETALFETPLIVLYKMNSLTFALAKLLVDIKYISLVNLIPDQSFVPELIQNDMNADNIVDTFENIYFDEKKRIETKDNLKKLRNLLISENPLKRLAEEIKNF